MFGWLKKEKSQSPGAAPAPKPATALEEKDLKVKVKERQGCRVTLRVQVPVDQVRQSTERAFHRIQAKAKMPGFRPGKAPLDMVKSAFSVQAWEEAVNTLLREGAFRALSKENLQAVSVPSVSELKAEMDRPLEFDLTVDCAPDLKLKDYKGLPLVKKIKPPTDEDVQKVLEELRESNARLAACEDQAVGAAHFVVVDYTASLDGRELPGGKAEGQLVDMAAPQSIAGFTQGLLGARAGETKQVKASFPTDHPDKERAGKELLFTVTVREIKEKRLPALDDEFAKDIGCENLDDLKARVRRDLAARRERELRQDMEKQVVDALLERHPFQVPETLVEERRQYLDDRLKRFLMNQGLTEDAWKNGAEKLSAKNNVEAEREVRVSYLLSAIAEAERIDVSDDDVDAMARTAVDQAKPEAKGDIQKWMSSRRDQVRAQLKEEKLLTFLIDNAKVEETTTP